MFCQTSPLISASPKEKGGQAAPRMIQVKGSLEAVLEVNNSLDRIAHAEAAYPLILAPAEFYASQDIPH